MPLGLWNVVDSQLVGSKYLSFGAQPDSPARTTY